MSPLVFDNAFFRVFRVYILNPGCPVAGFLCSDKLAKGPSNLANKRRMFIKIWFDR